MERRERVIEAMKAQDIILDNAGQFDTTGIAVPLIAIFENPVDYPDKVVARLYRCADPTNQVILGTGGVGLMRFCIEKYIKGAVWTNRGAADDPKLVGCYIL